MEIYSLLILVSITKLKVLLVSISMSVSLPMYFDCFVCHSSVGHSLYRVWILVFEHEFQINRN